MLVGPYVTRGPDVAQAWSAGAFFLLDLLSVCLKFEASGLVDTILEEKYHYVTTTKCVLKYKNIPIRQNLIL